MTDTDFDTPPAADPDTGEIVSAELVPVDEFTPPRAPTAGEVVVYPKSYGATPLAPTFWKLAQRIQATEMVPAAMRNRPDAILAAFMRGYEAGFGPMQALDSFDVIQGRVSLKAEAMRALVLDAGHQIVLEDVTDDSGKVVAVRANCRRKDWPPDMWQGYGYSLEDAFVAGLIGKDTWKKNPRSMLDARATSGACRRYFPDVLAGMSYTPEEVRDFDDTPAAITSPPPQPAQNGGAKKSAQPAKKAAKKAPAVKKPVQPDEGEPRPDEARSRLLPNGNIRITDAQVRAIVAAFSQLDTTYSKPERLRYARNVLRDESITSTWDLSTAQADELLGHLAEVNGEQPAT